ncbi:hypothetical protein INS49_005560 [Diaporthe citri]|uniref:uncharacterized protein n=1 Tax=Diaporthe citri TaxID=83186 RepID=UPI001C7FCAAA|nr:uncharacterized protein INS49_005560 [Diaporthe citri]KAG6353598.1 hypothetical protein INS49_005560 [Diaporthe citri]
MAPKFSEDQEVIYQGADGKYKGQVKKFCEKSGRFGSYYEYEVELTQKDGLETTVKSVTASSKTQDYEKMTPRTEKNVLEGSLSKA